MLLVFSVAISVVLIFLIIPKGTSRALTALRGFFIAVGSLVILFQFYNIAYTVRLRMIAPRAVVIVPRDYSGLFGISIGNFLKAGPKTAGKVFTYEIPSNGFLQVADGWIGLNFTGGPDPYTTQIQTTDGKTIWPSCSYVSEDYDVKKNSTGWTAKMKIFGVICMIGPGQKIGTPIPSAIRKKFINEHFKKQGAT
jgi:hypothetical protein